MNNLGQGFDLNSLPEGNSEFLAIEAGQYTASITQRELRDTRAGTGQYISVRFDITGPTNAGRVLHVNINIRNPNPDAERIGQQQLGELMRAIGIGRLTDTSQLIGHSCVIRVTKKQTNGKYADSQGYENEVRGFKALSGSPAPQPQAAAAPQQASTQPQPAAAGATPPWQK